MTATVDAARLASELETLAAFSDAAPPAVTRVVFTDTDRRARAFVTDLCTAAGFGLRQDAVGNTFARWVGSEPDLPAVATGLHIDAIPNAGRYDGTVGVLGGLEALRALESAGFRPRRSIELILFTSEEPTRFGIGCLGSRLLAGAIDGGTAGRLKDADGRTLDEVRRAAGFSGDLSTVQLLRGAYAAFVELHIEQGPILEHRGLDLGIVTAIAAPAGLRILIEGEGGHAGAVLMPARRDAFLAAAEIALAIEAAARGTGSNDTVATTGVCELFPGAVNSVPSRARLEVDVRDIDVERRDSVLQRIVEAGTRVADARRVSVRIDRLNADPPALCAPDLIAEIVRACDTRGLACERMISRAYHDALFMSRIAPMAMIFIPCRGGVSHTPDEYAGPVAIAQGATILADVLARLSVA